MRRQISCLLIFSLLAALLLTGCKGKIEIMDFEAPLELKTSEKKVSQTPKVLFIGNNFTYYNKMPDMFMELSKAAEYDPFVLDRSKAYYSLEKFANEEDLMGAAIQKDLYKNWDYVVLQDHINMAGVPDGLSNMEPYARKLDEDIKKSGAQTILFMTWGGKKGGTLPMGDSSIQLNAEEMNSLLAQNYITLSKELDSLLVPAAVAFMRGSKEYSKIDLWDQDGQHPSVAGSYLSACMFYILIYQESPVGNTYIGDLDQDTALKMQTLAKDIMLP